ncbi:MAG: serine/threonine-protein kinase [Blastocatellia bacterium]
MTAQRWERIEPILQQALALLPSERFAFLGRACQGDHELQREIEALLAVETIETSLNFGVPDTTPNYAPPPANLLGQRIGAYRVTRLLGRGGMGEVYEAVRDDQQFEQKVALKIVRHEMTEDFLRQRFLSERQILASLKHPHIAHLLDGGTTPAGLSYFVMEFIEGEPITDYCRFHDLSLADKLHLFQQVCSAVAHAHQKLVVHRDIKPNNILVNENGEAKLLDFGIAKLLDRAMLPRDAKATATDMRLMTPDYASPEQVRGNAITTATDVYSLGAVLYEIFTDTRPHRFRTITPLEIERVICESEILKPSEAVKRAPNAPIRLAKQLDGDLDNIILMAMRKEPERRYRSVEQFAEDIQRYLDGHLIVARADTIRYRTGKFLRRNRFTVVATALILLSLLSGLALANYQARRAERRFQQVRKLANTFLFDLDSKLQRLPGSTEARAMVVKTSLEYLDNLAQEAGNDPSLQLELAQAYGRVGDVQGNPETANLGQTAQAIESYRKAASLAEKLLRRDKQNPTLLHLLSRSYLYIGDLQAATGAGEAALQSLHQGLTLAEQLLQAEPHKLDNARLVVRGYSLLGDRSNTTNNQEKALEYYRAGLPIAERMAAEQPGEATQRLLSIIQDRIANALFSRGDLNGALQTFRQVQSIQEKLVKSPQPNKDDRYNLRLTYQAIGDVVGSPLTFSLGNPKAAAGYYRQALVIAEEFAEADPKDAKSQSDLTVIYRKMGNSLRDDDPAQSVAFIKRAVEVVATLLAAAPENLTFQRRQALNYLNIAYPLRRQKNYAEALKYLRLAEETQQAILAKDPVRTPVRQDLLATYNALGDVRLEMNDLNGAMEQYGKALVLAEKIAAAQPTDAYPRRDLADCYERHTNWFRQQALAPKTFPGDRYKHWRDARVWAQKNLAIWDNWTNYAASSSYNLNRREKAVRLLAECDAALAH